MSAYAVLPHSQIFTTILLDIPSLSAHLRIHLTKQTTTLNPHPNALLEILISNENAVSLLLKQQSFSKRKVQAEVINWALLWHRAEDKTIVFVLRDLEVRDAEKAGEQCNWTGVSIHLFSCSLTSLVWDLWSKAHGFASATGTQGLDPYPASAFTYWKMVYIGIEAESQ